MLLRTLKGVRKGKVFWVKSAQFTPQNIDTLQENAVYYVWMQTGKQCVIWKAIKVRDMET